MTMTAQAVISTTTTDKPKISPMSAGVVQVTFDIYGVSVDRLLELVGRELTIDIMEDDETL